MPNLRIGDLERDAAAESLSAHFAAGRLDHAELEERLSSVYAAKTGAELVPLFADLPGSALEHVVPARTERRAPAQRQFHPTPFPPLFLLLLLVASVAMISNGYPPVLPFIALILWRGGRRRRAYGRGWR
jgi:hypothetical protein